MKVETDEGTYVVYWRYDVDDKPGPYGCLVDLPIIQCVIAIPDGGTAGSAIATCGLKDVYVKETGRKLSFARALKEAGFDKPTRARFWQAYFGRFPGMTLEEPVLVQVPYSLEALREAFPNPLAPPGKGI